MNTKNVVYISAFTVLGVLLGFLLHAGVEIWYISGLVNNFETYSLGFSLDQWFLIHKFWSGLTFGGGLLFGYWQGRHWWRYIYIDKRLRRKK